VENEIVLWMVVGTIVAANLIGAYWIRKVRKAREQRLSESRPYI